MPRSADYLKKVESTPNSRKAPEFKRPNGKRPGFIGSFVKGLYAPPMDLGGSGEPDWTPTISQEWQVDALNDAERAALLPSYDFNPPEGGGGNFPAPAPTPYDTTPEPQGLVEGLGYDIGDNFESLLFGLGAAPGLGGAIGLGVPGSMALEGAASLGGLASGRSAKELGAGPLIQSGADIAASMIIPGAAISSAPRVVGRLASSPEGAVEASEAVVNYMRRKGLYDALPTGTRPPEADDAYEAAIQLQRQFPVGVDDPAKYRDRAVGRIEDVQGQFPDPNRQPSLAQTMGGPGTADLGGQNLVKRELQYTSTDPDYSSAAYGRRLETEEWVERAYEEEIPEFAGYASSRVSARAALDDAESRSRELWLEVPLEDMPSAPADELLEAVAKMREDIPGRPYIPREAAAIEAIAKEHGGRIPYSLLQSLSSELSTTTRAGDAAGPLSELAWRRSGRARKLQPLVERLLDEADPGDLASLRAARAATKRAKDIRTPIIEEIIKNGDPVDVLNRIRRADDISVTTGETIGILGQDGVAGLRAAAWDEIFGETLGSRTVRQMRSTMEARNNRQLYGSLFEPEQLEIIKTTIDRMARATSGRAATAAQASSTGTGYAPDVLQALEAFGRGNGSVTAQAMETVRRGYRRLGEATTQSMSIEKLASQDIELARLLLKVATPDNLPAMASVWRQALTRAQRRAPGAFSSGTGAQSASRTMGSGLLVEAHPDEIARIRAMRKTRP